MTHDAMPAYGLWGLVIINTAVFVIFAFSFTKPKTTRDWRSFGAFSAFIVALFSSNLPDFFFYEVEKETDKPNSEAIDLFRSTDL